MFINPYMDQLAEKDARIEELEKLVIVLSHALAATKWEETATELYRPIDIHGEEAGNDHGC
jgi:hypothetical protein